MTIAPAASADLVDAITTGAAPPGFDLRIYVPLGPVPRDERPITVDQTNVSVVVGERVVVKWMRTPEPDARAPRLLAHLAAAGFTRMPPPHAALFRDGALVALVTGFLPEAEDGWDWCTNALLASLDGGPRPTSPPTWADWPPTCTPPLLCSPTPPLLCSPTRAAQRWPKPLPPSVTTPTASGSATSHRESPPTFPLYRAMFPRRRRSSCTVTCTSGRCCAGGTATRSPTSTGIRPSRRAPNRSPAISPSCAPASCTWPRSRTAAPRAGTAKPCSPGAARPRIPCSPRTGPAWPRTAVPTCSTRNCCGPSRSSRNAAS
ncbi:hypothetical protein [Paractinoplanes durhamensis]|uniref:hypothetical protein n=1 Tax=Paractinoplanes durhamensis TaxID=113563 RepID=UPI003626686B